MAQVQSELKPVSQASEDDIRERGLTFLVDAMAEEDRLTFRSMKRGRKDNPDSSAEDTAQPTPNAVESHSRAGSSCAAASSSSSSSMSSDSEGSQIVRSDALTVPFAPVTRPRERSAAHRRNESYSASIETTIRHSPHPSDTLTVMHNDDNDDDHLCDAAVSVADADADRSHEQNEEDESHERSPLMCNDQCILEGITLTRSEQALLHSFHSDCQLYIAQSCDPRRMSSPDLIFSNAKSAGHTQRRLSHAWKRMPEKEMRVLLDTLAKAKVNGLQSEVRRLSTCLKNSRDLIQNYSRLVDEMVREKTEQASEDDTLACKQRTSMVMDPAERDGHIIKHGSHKKSDSNVKVMNESPKSTSSYSISHLFGRSNLIKTSKSESIIAGSEEWMSVDISPSMEQLRVTHEPSRSQSPSKEELRKSRMIWRTVNGMIQILQDKLNQLERRLEDREQMIQVLNWQNCCLVETLKQMKFINDSQKCRMKGDISRVMSTNDDGNGNKSNQNENENDDDEDNDEQVIIDQDSDEEEKLDKTPEQSLTMPMFIELNKNDMNEIMIKEQGKNYARKDTLSGLSPSLTLKALLDRLNGSNNDDNNKEEEKKKDAVRSDVMICPSLNDLCDEIEQLRELVASKSTEVIGELTLRERLQWMNESSDAQNRHHHNHHKKRRRLRRMRGGHGMIKDEQRLQMVIEIVLHLCEKYPDCSEDCITLMTHLRIWHLNKDNRMRESRNMNEEWKWRFRELSIKIGHILNCLRNSLKLRMMNQHQLSEDEDDRRRTMMMKSTKEKKKKKHQQSKKLQKKDAKVQTSVLGMVNEKHKEDVKDLQWKVSKLRMFVRSSLRNLGSWRSHYASAGSMNAGISGQTMTAQSRAIVEKGRGIILSVIDKLLEWFHKVDEEAQLDVNVARHPHTVIPPVMDSAKQPDSSRQKKYDWVHREEDEEKRGELRSLRDDRKKVASRHHSALFPTTSVVTAGSSATMVDDGRSVMSDRTSGDQCSGSMRRRKKYETIEKMRRMDDRRSVMTDRTGLIGTSAVPEQEEVDLDDCDHGDPYGQSDHNDDDSEGDQSTVLSLSQVTAPMVVRRPVPLTHTALTPSRYQWTALRPSGMIHHNSDVELRDPTKAKPPTISRHRSASPMSMRMMGHHSTSAATSSALAPGSVTAPPMMAFPLRFHTAGMQPPPALAPPFTVLYPSQHPGGFGPIPMVPAAPASVASQATLTTPRTSAQSGILLANPSKSLDRIPDVAGHISGTATDYERRRVRIKKKKRKHSRISAIDDDEGADGKEGSSIIISSASRRRKERDKLRKHRRRDDNDDNDHYYDRISRRHPSTEVSSISEEEGSSSRMSVKTAARVTSQRRTLHSSRREVRHYHDQSRHQLRQSVTDRSRRLLKKKKEEEDGHPHSKHDDYQRKYLKSKRSDHGKRRRDGYYDDKRENDEHHHIESDLEGQLRHSKRSEREWYESRGKKKKKSGKHTKESRRAHHYHHHHSERSLSKPSEEGSLIGSDSLYSDIS